MKNSVSIDTYFLYILSLFSIHCLRFSLCIRLYALDFACCFDFIDALIAQRLRICN